MEQSAAEFIESCPLCNHPEHVSYLELDDYFLTHEKFSILKCTECGLMRTNPQPSGRNIGRYYDSPEYISHSTARKSFKDRLYDLVRKRTLVAKKNILDKYSKGKSLLDIGCATGVFIDYCRKKGYTVQGIEPDEKCRNYARTVLNLEVNDTDAMKSMKDKSFDVITMWHVLEHVGDLNERMMLISKMLKDDGVLIVALPNPDSYDANYYGKYWAAYDVPRHLFHFTKDAFKKLCNKFSFEVINILPMMFDSFYISLLSEKYSKGKTSLFNAFLIGLKSNLKAQSGTNHSSLIYIIRKKN
ncbi:MAG TPA: class I SAM-dependent methyltransferase [Lentimicrobium sp.]|nr:class I SAM-dependent methyltransferase [Lentimicrobium sp.]